MLSALGLLQELPKKDQTRKTRRATASQTPPTPKAWSKGTLLKSKPPEAPTRKDLHAAFKIHPPTKKALPCVQTHSGQLGQEEGGAHRDIDLGDDPW